MTAPTTSKYVLKTPDSETLPNSSVLTTDDNFQINKSYNDTTLVLKGDALDLSNFNGLGIVNKTLAGLLNTFIAGGQSLKITNASGINGDIDISFVPKSTNQLVTVVADNVTKNNISKLNFVAGENVLVESGFNASTNQAEITFSNTALGTAEKRLFTQVFPSCENILNLDATNNLETQTIDLELSYNTNGSVYHSVIECIVDEENNKSLIWGEPISNLKSLTFENPDSDILTVTSTPTTIGDNDSGTITLDLGAPPDGNVYALGYDFSESKIDWLSISSSGIETVNLVAETDNGSNNVFDITCSVTPPITDTGSFAINAIPASDKQVIVTTTNPSPPNNKIVTYDTCVVQPSIATNAASEDVIVVSGNTPVLGTQYTFNLGFNTTGASLDEGFQYNSGTGKVEIVGLSSFNKVSSFGMGIISGSEGVLDGVGTPNPIITTGEFTLRHKNVPFANFNSTAQNGQLPAYYGNNKAEWGRISTGPLLFIANGEITFPAGGTGPIWELTQNAFSGTISGLDINRVIAIAQPGGNTYDPGKTPSEGILRCNITYASNILTLTITTRYSARGNGDQNTYSNWFLYYYPEY